MFAVLPKVSRAVVVAVRQETAAANPNVRIVCIYAPFLVAQDCSSLRNWWCLGISAGQRNKTPPTVQAIAQRRLFAIQNTWNDSQNNLRPLTAARSRQSKYAPNSPGSMKLQIRISVGVAMFDAARKPATSPLRARIVATKFWTFRWEYYCQPCREYGWCGAKAQGYMVAR